MSKLRILGIDPGSVRTGYGLLDVEGTKLRYVDSGVIRLPKKSLPERLGIIYSAISQLVEEHAPEEMAVEEVFFARDPRGALKLGQARGAAIVAGSVRQLLIAEYAPRLIKQSVVGKGAADKKQVQFMVQKILCLSASPAEDAADALAVAICHAHLRKSS